MLSNTKKPEPLAAQAAVEQKTASKAEKPVRGLGVTVSGFDGGVEQLSFDSLAGEYDKKARAEAAVGEIRKKYGYSKIQRGIMFEDKRVLGMDVRGERLKRPVPGREEKDIDDE